MAAALPNIGHFEVKCACGLNQLSAEAIFVALCPPEFIVCQVVPQRFHKKPVCRWSVQFQWSPIIPGQYFGGENAREAFNKISWRHPLDAFIHEKYISDFPPSFNVVYGVKCNCKPNFRNFTTPKSGRENIVMASSIANIVKSSLGPVGIDKKLVDYVGDVTVTNDGATISILLEVEQHAAKVLVELAQLQNEKIGDGTTPVVILAAELLKNFNELVKQKIHPTSIISRYRFACKEACKYISEHLTADSDFFSALVVDAAQTVIFLDPESNPAYAIKAVNVLKQIARATGASYLTSLTNMVCEESSDAAMVGEATEVIQEIICDDELILIKEPEARTASSIILRGPNDFYCDEMERSVHDALCVLEGRKFVADSCVAAILSYLENFAISLSPREQLVIAEYTNFLFVILKTLAVNAANDDNDLIAKLRACQTKLEQWCGFDLMGMVKAGVSQHIRNR